MERDWELRLRLNTYPPANLREAGFGIEYMPASRFAGTVAGTYCWWTFHDIGGPFRARRRDIVLKMSIANPDTWDLYSSWYLNMQAYHQPRLDIDSD